MSIRDMIKSIRNEFEQDIQSHKDKLNVEITKSLIDYGEFCEKSREKQLHEFILLLEHREKILRTEQEFRETNRIRHIEDHFITELLTKIRKSLLNFVKKDQEYYKQVMYAWLTKSLDIIGYENLTIEIMEGDIPLFQELFSALKLKFSFLPNDAIEAGFLIHKEGGVSIDLTFSTVFHEKQNHLLQLLLPILKESL